MQSSIQQNRRRGFSLIELVIVVVIIGIIGAIAIPRLSRGAEGAGDSALKGDLAVFRSAIDLYATEHNGTYPSASDIADQLTQYTDISGDVSSTKTTTHVYGPYMRAIPALKVGDETGSTDIAAAPGSDVGWVYAASTGTITPNTDTAKDASGKLYTDY